MKREWLLLIAMATSFITSNHFAFAQDRQPWFGGIGNGYAGGIDTPGPCGTVIGVYGNSGDFLDGLGLICDGGRWSKHVGGFGGNAFSPFVCPSGFVANSVFGEAGLYINAIGLTCVNPSTGEQHDIGPTPHRATAKSFRYSCPAAQKLRGLYVFTGQFVDGFQPVCAPFASSYPLPPLRACEQCPEIPDSPAPWFGGGGGSLDSPGLCPAVTGFYGNSGDWLNGFALVCQGERAYPKHLGGSGGSTFPTSLCPTGFIANGVFGEAGQYVNAIGLVCFNPTTGDQRDLGPSPHRAAAKSFRYLCPSGQKLTGINARDGEFIDAIQAVCGPLTLSNPTPVITKLESGWGTRPVYQGYNASILFAIDVPWGCAPRGSYSVDTPRASGNLWEQSGFFTFGAVAPTLVHTRFWCSGYGNYGVARDVSINVVPPPPQPAPPMPPPGVHGIQKFTFQLQLVPVFQGPLPYAAQFPAPGLTLTPGMTLISLTNVNPLAVGLVTISTGHTTAQCFSDPKATVVLTQNGTTSPDNIQSIFGAKQPALPVNVVACIAAGAQAPGFISLTATYNIP
jgi:hypothetical protein